jgi:hypothetical protein
MWYSFERVKANTGIFRLCLTEGAVMTEDKSMDSRGKLLSLQTQLTHGPGLEQLLRSFSPFQ